MDTTIKYMKGRLETLEYELEKTQKEINKSLESMRYIKEPEEDLKLMVHSQTKHKLIGAIDVLRDVLSFDGNL